MNSIAGLLVEVTLEHAGEGVEVDRLVVRLAAGGNELVQRFAAKPVGLGEDFLHALPFRVLAHAVGIHDVVHQRRGRHARILGARCLALFRLAGGQFLQEG